MKTCKMRMSLTQPKRLMLYTQPVKFIAQYSVRFQARLPETTVEHDCLF